MSNKIKVFLDDERPAPDNSWVRCYTVEQCIALLEARIASHISFDNDLGEGQPEGYMALNALEEMIYNDPTFPVPIITVHSANAGRVPSMRRTVLSIERIRQPQLEEEINNE